MFLALHVSPNLGMQGHKLGAAVNHVLFVFIPINEQCSYVSWSSNDWIRPFKNKICVFICLAAKI